MRHPQVSHPIETVKHTPVEPSNSHNQTVQQLNYKNIAEFIPIV